MLKLFKPGNRSILGIDISSSAVKILELSGSDKQRCIEGYAHATLPPHAIDGNVIKDIDAIAYCIKNAHTSAKLSSTQVAVAVPDSAVITKIVEVDSELNDAEMEESIIIEADKYIPYPVDEINLDFEILGHSTKNTALLDVLLVASRAEHVNVRLEVIERAGLEARIVDVESYSVERAVQPIAKELSADGQDKIVAIIDIGANYTHLFVLLGMRLIFSREEKFGGTQLIDAIAEHYQITPEDALEAKDSGTLPDDYNSLILEPFKEMVLLQIKRTLQLFYSTSEHGFVNHILLAGGVARQRGLASLIQEQLGIVTNVVNPLSHMSFSKTVDKDLINHDAPALMVACGLALRNIT